MSGEREADREREMEGQENREKAKHIEERMKDSKQRRTPSIQDIKWKSRLTTYTISEHCPYNSRCVHRSVQYNMIPIIFTIGWVPCYMALNDKKDR